jgi:hypothetical protein
MIVRDAIRKTKGYLGARIHGLAYNIDTVNGGCPVACPSCSVGSIGRRKGGRMPIELFRKILDKAEAESPGVRNVQLYAHSDPSMHPEAHLFIQECTDRKIPAIFSSVLQRPQCDWKKVIEARPRELRISFPGLEQMSYYQAGANPDEFLKNFYHLTALPRHKETTWTLGFHLYNDNGHELERARDMVEKTYTEQDKELITHLCNTPEDWMAQMRHSDFCACQSKQITIDSLGYVYLCQNVYSERFRMVHFLDSSVERIRREMMEHPFCVKCKEVAGNTYQENYSYLFGKDPVAKANKGRFKN